MQSRIKQIERMDLEAPPKPKPIPPPFRFTIPETMPISGNLIAADDDLPTHGSKNNTTQGDEVDEEAEIVIQKEMMVARWALWWILPPSLTTASMSRWMGGDMYPSAALGTILLVAVLVLYMVITS